MKNKNGIKLNIYEFNWDDEKDWVIASSKKRAIEIHQSITGIDKKEYDSVVSMIKKKDWVKYEYYEEDPKNSITFKEYMETQCVDEDFFCTTMC